MTSKPRVSCKPERYAASVSTDFLGNFSALRNCMVQGHFCFKAITAY